jgi:hypothetical protein
VSAEASTVSIVKTIAIANGKFNQNSALLSFLPHSSQLDQKYIYFISIVFLIESADKVKFSFSDS